MLLFSPFHRRRSSSADHSQWSRTAGSHCRVLLRIHTFITIILIIINFRDCHSEQESEESEKRGERGAASGPPLRRGLVPPGFSNWNLSLQSHRVQAGPGWLLSPGGTISSSSRQGPQAGPGPGPGPRPGPRPELGPGPGPGTKPGQGQVFPLLSSQHELMTPSPGRRSYLYLMCVIVVL